MSGDKIRIARVTKGYSQEYMAFMLEISQSTYSNVESGTTEITVQRLFEIAEILEVKITSLIPDSQLGSIADLSALTKLFLKAKIWFRKKSPKAILTNT